MIEAHPFQYRLRTPWRLVVVAVLAVCSASYVLLFVQLKTGRPNLAGTVHRPAHDDARNPLFASLSLTDAQCRATFPGLTNPIDDQVSRGSFALPPARSDLGPLQARVRSGQLFVISAEKPGLLPPELLDARAAVLHQIHRALLTAPESGPDGGGGVPDTVFAVNVQDQPFGTAWTYSLPAYAAPTAGNAPIGRAFLMPHFSFWAWRPRMVGSFGRAAAAIAAVESALAFRDKDPRAVWRGTARFASAHHPALRTQLLGATGNASWADVQELDWLADGGNANAMQEARNALPIEDFCRYKYVVHTEGITYSGRFQFHQLCRSVVLTPPIAWLQHTTHLVRPLYASGLNLDVGSDFDSDWQPSPDEEAAWPHAAPGEANLVFVAPDWSNLGATVRWLERHPDIAEGIAQRQRALFSAEGSGYLSPAAETCYWRALLRGWQQVVQYNDSALPEGVPWETFSLST